MSPEAERKAQELVSSVAQTFKAEVVARRAGKLAAGAELATGEVWGGPEAVRLGLVDELATIDQVMQTRWPGVQTYDLGPRSAGLPFSSAASEWFGQLVRSVLRRAEAPLALR